VLSLDAYCDKEDPHWYGVAKLLRGVGGPDITGFLGGSSVGYRPELSRMSYRLVPDNDALLGYGGRRESFSRMRSAAEDLV